MIYSQEENVEIGIKGEDALRLLADMLADAIVREDFEQASQLTTRLKEAFPVVALAWSRALPEGGGPNLEKSRFGVNDVGRYPDLAIS